MIQIGRPKMVLVKTFGPAKVRTSQVCSAEICNCEVSVKELGLLEVSIFEKYSLQVSMPKICPPKVSPLQDCSSEVNTNQGENLPFLLLLNITPSHNGENGSDVSGN